MFTSQSQWVLSCLESGERLSSRDAVLYYGIQDLPKRISELRKRGYEIESARVEGTNRRGGKTHWNVYWLDGDDHESNPN